MAESPATHTIGRRKEARCRLYLKPGSGKWQVNGRTLGDYFPRSAHVAAIQQPFTATDTLGRFDIMARVEGGGLRDGGALRIAVARALASRRIARRKLRDLGLLTRMPAQSSARSQDPEGTQEVTVSSVKGSLRMSEPNLDQL